MKGRYTPYMVTYMILIKPSEGEVRALDRKGEMRGGYECEPRRQATFTDDAKPVLARLTRKGNMNIYTIRQTLSTTSRVPVSVFRICRTNKG